MVSDATVGPVVIIARPARSLLAESKSGDLWILLARRREIANYRGKFQDHDCAQPAVM